MGAVAGAGPGRAAPREPGTPWTFSIPPSRAATGRTTISSPDSTDAPGTPAWPCPRMGFGGPGWAGFSRRARPPGRATTSPPTARFCSTGTSSSTGTRRGVRRASDWPARATGALGPSCPSRCWRLGPRGSWDERARGRSVCRSGRRCLLPVLPGQDRARRQRLGVARFAGRRRAGTSSRANPILELGAPGAFDENGLGEPAVWASHGWYWMLYTGRDRRENRRIGLARSRDGVRWERLSEPP